MPQREDEEEDSEANRARWFVRSGLEEKVYITARLDHRWHIQMCFFISTSLRAVEERKREQHINYIRFWHEQILKSDFTVEPLGFFIIYYLKISTFVCFLMEGNVEWKLSSISIHWETKKRTNNQWGTSEPTMFSFKSRSSNCKIILFQCFGITIPSYFSSHYFLSNWKEPKIRGRSLSFFVVASSLSLSLALSKLIAKDFTPGRYFSKQRFQPWSHAWRNISKVRP